MIISTLLKWIILLFITLHSQLAVSELDTVYTQNSSGTYYAGTTVQCLVNGDGTDLTIASSAKLNLNATSDVHLPANVGLVFDANASEKIESNDTDLTITSGADINCQICIVRLNLF